VRGEKNRLRKDTTEELEIPEPFKKNVKGMPEKIFNLRQKLYIKAKREPGFRFYALYDRIYRTDVIQEAWRQVGKNGGGPGVDGVSIQKIRSTAESEKEFLEEIQESLRKKSYAPEAVKRVHIPKANGKYRPLGIPTVRDRVVQTATLLILEPIFEADFLESSYGFRPGKSAHHAIKELQKSIKEGRNEVYDADLQSYFDTIPHEKLMACVEKKISDSSVLRLIRNWLKAIVVEQDNDGKKQYQRSSKGTPQGGVISPLLANLYLHYFDKIMQKGPCQWANAKMIRYADDFVVVARYIGKPIIDTIETFVEGRMALAINRDKTSIKDLRTPRTAVDFLGYTFRYDKDQRGRPHRYLNVAPSKKSLQRARDRIREMTGPSQCFKPLPELIKDLNLYLRGWSEYFQLGHPYKAKKQINTFTRERLVRHLRRRSQRPFRPPEGVKFYEHINTQGLIYI